MNEVVYLDHNATTPLLPNVIETMLPYLTTDFGNPSSDHVFGRKARLAVDAAREQVAQVIGAHADEIVFTSGGTESNNLAIQGAAHAVTLPRRTIVTSVVEHPATENPVLRLQSEGWRIRRLPVTRQGSVDGSTLGTAIGVDVALVTMMLAQNETGALMPVREAGEIARQAGAIVHTDAAQAIGKIPVDVDALNVDLLSIAGHKLNAPKGIGALYVRRGTALHPVLLGAAQERGIRPGTENVASIVALGAAAHAAAEGLDERAARYCELRDQLWAALQAAVPGITRHTPLLSLPNTLSVSFPGVSGSDVLANAPGIAASTGSACHSGIDRPSSVLIAMGIGHAEAMGTVRLSLGHGTEADDMARAAGALGAAFDAARFA